MDRRGVVLLDDGRDQVVARRIGEIVMQIGIAVDVDLRGQMAVARGGDEEVDVRRA
jgi:hypothetical protein